MPVHADLPYDIATLKALLLARDGEVCQLRDTISTLEQTLNERMLEIEQLKLQIARLKRMQFGRKSEKIDRKIEQLKTRLEDLIAKDGAAEEVEISPAPSRTKPARKPLPEHLVRDEGIVNLPQPPQSAKFCKVGE